VFHDIEINRDIIISVDRMFEMCHTMKLPVGIVDLLLLATGKYLVDFYGFNLDEIRIVTTDDNMYRLCRKLPDFPYIYNPALDSEVATKIFTDDLPDIS
jgi:hypothetical protein